MTWLLAAHLLVAGAVVVLAPRLGSRVLLVGALAPATAAVWLTSQVPAVVGGATPSSSWEWAPTLGLVVPLRLDVLSLVLGLVVTVVGVLVLLYAAAYLRERTDGLGRTAGLLVVFAGAMLALVLVDSLLGLYVAWELTTLCSFLLIGDGGRARANRRAALRALLVTTGAGFVMLLGLVLLRHEAGTDRISSLLAQPPDGGLVQLAVLLVLVGALAKCAQVPLHAWLPEAMAAPTPVSAYLHAAAMVKAGIYLVARLAPGFSDLAVWGPVVLGVGVASMLLGGWRALAQTDLKRLLAFGTIAQLGFLVVLLGAGTRVATLAGLTMLAAHALFKSTLFCVVGAIEHLRGTRDLRELAGHPPESPFLLGAALLACASMVGLPPFVGYLGKEAALEVFLEPGPAHGWVLAGITLGSVLTVAYTLRLLAGAFGGRDRTTRDRAARDEAGRAATSPDPLWWGPPVALALAGLAVGLAPGHLDELVAPAADRFSEGSPDYHLALWHGLGWPVLLSLLSLAAGAAVHLLGEPLGRWRERFALPVDATGVEDSLARRVLAGARVATARTHTRALSDHLAVTMLTLSTLVAVPLLPLLRSGRPRLFDDPAQPVLAAGIAVCCVVLVRVRHRVTLVVVLSTAGYLVTGLFVVNGAPDLALAQLLVETLTFVVLVLVLRRMPSRDRPTGSMPRPTVSRLVRATAALALGTTACAAALVASTSHVRSRVAAHYLEHAPEEGGPNAVNVIITEYRALDTLGESTVLVVAATAVAGLVLAGTRMGRPPRVARTPAESHDERTGGTSR